MIEVIIKNLNKTVTVKEGTTLAELKDMVYPIGSGVKGQGSRIIGATVNNVASGLATPLFQNKTVRFVTVADQEGREIYLNSLTMVLSKAVSDSIRNGSFIIEHSISGGYFVRIFHGQHVVTKLKGEIVKRKMAQIINADIPFYTFSKPTPDVVKLMESKGNSAAADILKFRKSYYTTYYQLADTAEYVTTGTVPSTSYLKVFDLQPYYDGWLLQLPNPKKPDEVTPLTLMPRLYNTYKNNWSLEHKARLTGVAELNNLKESDVPTMIMLSEALHEKNIVRISDKITSNSKIKVVLIAGPSSSGKTTFSKRLSVQLATSGVKPVPLSLDNYFVNRNMNPIDENGQLDFESLYSLDLEKFYADLEGLIKGETVETPVYNFETGLRNEASVPMKLNDSEVLIIEGTHALNPELTKTLPQKALFKIFVSALNTMSLNDHICIAADDTRLLRRIIRDYKYRGYSAEDTILRWPSVRRGEFKWIDPFMEEADEMFNSTLLFELAATSRQALPLLMEVPHYSDAYPIANRLRTMLRFIKPINFNSIPATSLLREFLGGSGFKY
ncbi:MAG: nucleoside kinase [Paludibacteraceae bacterium]|nr:nucleoside kinase [Paludibacteraceae bacterium]